MKEEQHPQATWIWYPGDFEIWLGNRFNNRRTERGAMFPPFWKQDSHWPMVVFTKTVNLEEEERVSIWVEGQFNFSIDGRLQYPIAEQHIPKGTHTLSIKVCNQATPPALFIQGKKIVTDASWQTTYEDKIWIDENGVAHGSGIYVPVGYWHFDQADTPPSQYRLARKPLFPVAQEKVGENDMLYDFGRETFGCLKLSGLSGSVRVFYGESREEALDKDHCETLDLLCDTDPNCQADDASHTFELGSKAFRFVDVECIPGTTYSQVSMDFEYAPFDEARSGSFECSDDELNHIWQVAAYTMDLTTREFFVDGIKRDRWTWSGDAIQSYLMNYYLRFDIDCVRRTIRQLRGKDPVTAHINTIMDYTFYWFKSILDYYQYTADLAFVREMWPRMVTLMDYVLRRTNADGMAEGKPDDWIFVDWVDFPMHKRGTLCFEQLLFCKALETMHTCATLIGADSPYGELATKLLAKTKATFWNESRHAFRHAIEDGKMNDMVTKFPNMFAIIYDYADERERDAILHHVLLNGQVEPITTPYMRFYELEALCMMGQQPQVLTEMKSYWGGMLLEGATTFWEKYIPSEHGTQHLAMYGRPYGKSLCHAWGASPIYLLGRYFLGVAPTKAGYEEYEVRPVLGGLAWMRGRVPTPFGGIEVDVEPGSITVRSDGGHGTLIIGHRHIDIPAHQEVKVESH